MTGVKPIRHKKLFNYINNVGQKVYNKIFTVVYIKVSDVHTVDESYIEHYSVKNIYTVIIVPKKRFGLAVLRNKIKRRIRSVLRDAQKGFNTPDGKIFSNLMLIIIPKSSINTHTFDMIRTSLLSCLNVKN